MAKSIKWYRDFNNEAAERTGMVGYNKEACKYKAEEDDFIIGIVQGVKRLQDDGQAQCKGGEVNMAIVWCGRHRCPMYLCGCRKESD